ncbi:hypothetical protein GCM10027098_42120 [Bowmanella dokdonensis]
MLMSPVNDEEPDSRTPQESAPSTMVVWGETNSSGMNLNACKAARQGEGMDSPSSQRGSTKTPGAF